MIHSLENNTKKKQKGETHVGNESIAESSNLEGFGFSEVINY